MRLGLAYYVVPTYLTAVESGRGRTGINPTLYGDRQRLPTDLDPRGCGRNRSLFGQHTSRVQSLTPYNQSINPLAFFFVVDFLCFFLRLSISVCLSVSLAACLSFLRMTTACCGSDQALVFHSTALLRPSLCRGKDPGIYIVDAITGPLDPLCLHLGSQLSLYGIRPGSSIPQYPFT